MTANSENMSTNNNQSQKTVLRKRLEEIEIEIYNSWLKDQDKIKELLELTSILEGIYSQSSIEDYFENASDFEYFCKRFTSEVISNILKQHLVYGQNGDEVALNVLFYYLRIFFKFMDKPQYQGLWESIREIFDSNKNYYKGAVYGSMRNFNEKKLLSAEKYNEMKLTRKTEAKLCITEGMELDVLIDYKRMTGQQLEKKVWVRGKVARIESEYFVVYVSEETYPIFLKSNSFEFAPKGTMTKDWDWRSDLQQWQIIDCYDRGRWYPATILYRKEDEVNGIPKIEYRIGFRVYVDQCENWEEYRKNWPMKDINKDSHGRVYLGDVENLDEWIPSYSKRIQKLNTMINSDSKLADSFESENYFIDDMVKFQECSEKENTVIENINNTTTTTTTKKNYIIGRNNGFYYYFALMVNYFCEMGGFEKMIKSLSKKDENRPSPDLVHNIFYILHVSSGFFHKAYVIELGKNLYENIFNYLNDMNQNELRNIKKDTFDLILKVLRFYLGLSLGVEERNQIIEKFSITFAIKMIKTAFLEKRIISIKTIIDVIKSTKGDTEKRMQILKLIEENQIFYEIYGPNSHIQLINKSKDLLEIMLQEDKLSDGEMEMIWGATKKGDLEGKLTILKTLKDISKALQPKHIKVLLDNIYRGSSGSELINDEIDLIYELSTHSSQTESTLEKCIKFFTGCLLENRSDEGEKIEILINKIFEITKFNPSFKTSVINMTIESLEKNENVILALKILQKYLKEGDLDTDYDLNELLVKNDSLVKLFCANFIKYINFVREKAKNWTQEIDLLPLRDHFNHTQNLKSRLNFMNMLLTLKLWRINEDPIEFVYKTIIEEGVSEKDKNEFFNWIKNAIEKNVDFETEEKIFKLFNQKLCNDIKSCQHLSIEAFDTYLKVFLDINQQNKSLKYSRIPRESHLELDVYVEPEKLIGFQILWKIVFESFSVDIMNKGIEILHSLFTNVQIEQITNDTAEQISATIDNTSYSQLLLKKCITLIKVTNDNNSLSIDEKRNIITKCLTILKLMVEESEKRGTVRIKSHAGILKKNTINVTVNASCGLVNLREFSLKLYANTTIWELKELISLHLQYCLDFLKIHLKSNYELKNTDHGKTLLDLNIEEGDEIKCSSNGLEKMISQADLHLNNSPTDHVMSIFNEWYERFNTNGKMTKEDCSRFIRAVTNCKEEITQDDHRIVFLFSTYDRNKDDLLEKEEFMQFYNECVSKPEKRKIVWDNMKSMGIRNDLKKMSEPYNSYNEDKTILPRYQLSHNEDFFHTVFYLQDLHEEIAKEAFNFLCIISTNPAVYASILLLSDSDETIDWNVLLNEANIYKLIYSLQIIESFLEDIEIKKENVDTLPGGNNILGDFKEEELEEKKIQWMRNFVQKGGYTHLVNILQKKLVFLVHCLKKNEVINNSLMNNILIEFLLKIVRIFYFSSLNKFESYKKTIASLTKSISILNITSEINSDLKRERSGSLQRASSNYIDLSSLDTYFIQNNLNDFILNSFDHNVLTENLIQLTTNLINKENKSKQELDIIITSFEFLTVVIPFNQDAEKAESIVLVNKNFVSISLYGLLNSSVGVRETFSNSLIKLCKLLQYSDRFNLLLYLFLNIFELIENISPELEKNSNELFEFFSYLLEIYLNNQSKFQNTEINPKQFLKSMLDNLEADINEVDGKVVNLSNELFIGYLKIVTKVAESNLEIKSEISNNYNLIQGILTKVLFKQNSQELKDKLSKFQFINPDTIDDSKSNRNSNLNIRNVSYNFILSMLKDSIDNFEKFFSINVLESQDNSKKEENQKSVSKYFSYSNLSRNESHVGLKNLGCICYMNAMLQQFFMVPSLRYSLLKADDKIAREVNLNNAHNVDDNSLHQVQRMFSFLELSERMDYNPFAFCYSFKDWEGNPTNTSIQQDAQEFLSRFLDMIENQIKPTPHKYVFQSIFGGKTCTLLTCEQGCGSVSKRFEDFYTLSLEVNNMKTLNDSLEKLISPEKIDDYDCDTCKRKVAITKRNLLASLPNVLIVHLQRLFYNYEQDRNEKINSRLEFPKVLNLKDYCLEEVTRRNTSKKEDDEEGSKLEHTDSDDTYFKHPSYYEYHLAGVVVHMGSAEAGHYYSYINSVRGGVENEANFNPKDESHVNSWLEFNDSYISKFNVSKLEDECYGGVYDNDRERNDSSWVNFNRGEKTKSAYMLVYERRIKSPIKTVIENNINNSTFANLISFKEEESARVKKQFDLSRYIDTPEYNSIKEQLFRTTFFDVAKNEYYSYTPYYAKDRLIPQKYYLEIMEDNSNFQKHQNTSDERFVNFFDMVINLLDDAMSNLTEIKPETSVKISITFMDFIFNILSQKDKQQLLKTAKDKFVHILQTQPACLIPVWQYINDHQKSLGDLLLNNNDNVVQNNVELIYELIKMAYLTSPAEFIEALMKNDYDDNMYSYVKKTIEYILSMFPRVSSKLVSKTGPLLKLLRDISLLGDEIYTYFSHKEIIFTFVTFMLGRESPCYNETLMKQGDNWDFGRNQLSDFEPIVDLIYEIFARSRENKLFNMNIDNEGNEGIEVHTITDSLPTCTLSIRDVKCLKSPNFLKFIFKNCDRVFSALLVNANFEDEEFTLQSCVEITKYIDEIYAFNGADFVKLFYAITPLLRVKDTYQRTRFEIIIGIPQITIEETNGKYAFPLMGYHNLSDERSKYIEHKGTITQRNMCSVIKKMFLLKMKDTFSVQIFLAILEACIDNYELLKFIRKMPGEEPAFESFIEWGVALVNAYGKTDQNIFYEKLKEHVSKINPILDKVMSDNDILPGTKGFVGKYLLKDIKREEITLIMQRDNLYLIQSEYFGNSVNLGGNVDYSSSRSYIGGGSLLEDEEKIKKEGENISFEGEGSEGSNTLHLQDEFVPEDVQLISSETKINISEKEFLKKILPNFSTYKKIIVENKCQVVDATSLLKRFIIFNNGTRDTNVDFKIKRLSTPNSEDINEYVPNSAISMFVPSQIIRNLYLMPKLFADREWCDAGNLEFDLEVELANNKGIASNQNYNHGSYGGVTNTPAPEFINYTQYANYSNNRPYGPSGQYPNINSNNNNQNEANTRLSEIDDDEDEDYGVNY